MSGDASDCHKWGEGGATDIQGVEARDAPHSKEVSSPKGLQSEG